MRQGVVTCKRRVQTPGVATAVSCGKCGGATVPTRGMSYCILCDWYTNWPPTEEWAVVWARFEAAGFNDDEKTKLHDLLGRWMDETSRLVAYTDEDGNWVDVEWPWSDES